MNFLMLLMMMIIAALLGLLPASIAKSKGHSFGKWWFYGWLLFGVAIIHVMFISDDGAEIRQKAVSGDAGSLGRIYSLLAGLDFLILSIISIFHGVRYGWITDPIEVLFCSSLWTFAIVLLIGKKNKGILAVSIFYALLNLKNVPHGIYEAMCAYGAVLLAVLTAGSVLPSLRKNASKMVKKAWFLPAIYFLVDFLVWQMALLPLGLSFLATLWYVIVIRLLRVTGIFFIGLWLQVFPEEDLTQKQEPVAVIYTESYLKKQTEATEKSVSEERTSEAEEALRSYRALVDSGLMTKAEYEEKKRQLLEE